MPFIEQWRRNVIAKHGLEGLAEIQPGDRCYVYYKRMVDAWRKEPRWNTAHRLCKDMMLDVATNGYDQNKEDDGIACFLAWEVFFHIHVMPYEHHKSAVNGDIGVEIIVCESTSPEHS